MSTLACHRNTSLETTQSPSASAINILPTRSLPFSLSLTCSAALSGLRRRAQGVSCPRLRGATVWGCFVSAYQAIFLPDTQNRAPESAASCLCQAGFSGPEVDRPYMSSSYSSSWSPTVRMCTYKSSGHHTTLAEGN